MTFDFSKTKMNLEGINNYLEAQGIKLTASEKKQINTIFKESDTWNDKEKKSGSDGVLNALEASLFSTKLGVISQKIKGSVDKLIKELGLKFEPVRKGIHVEIPDATRVSNVERELGIAEAKPIDIQNVVQALSKEQMVNNAYDKYHSKFPKSPLKKEFFNKLYDTIKTLKCTISDKDFKPDKYLSKEEQTFDEVIAILAGESQLDPKSIKGSYNGLFQLGTSGLTDAKRWAKAHPDVKGMQNVRQNMTITGFIKCSGETQLDYLVAYIGICKSYSHIKNDETISPAQLWAMIKLPSTGKNTKKIADKAVAIDSVFNNNEIPYGLN